MYSFDFKNKMLESVSGKNDELYYSDCTFQEFWDGKPRHEEVYAKAMLNRARRTDNTDDWAWAFTAYQMLGKKYGLIISYCLAMWKNTSQRDLAEKFISEKP